MADTTSPTISIAPGTWLDPRTAEPVAHPQLMRHLAERNDFRAQALLQRCEGALREHLGADAARPLAEALAGFDFTRARETLGALARALAARAEAAS